MLCRSAHRKPRCNDGHRVPCRCDLGATRSSVVLASPVFSPEPKSKVARNQGEAETGMLASGLHAPNQSQGPSRTADSAAPCRKPMEHGQDSCFEKWLIGEKWNKSSTW